MFPQNLLNKFSELLQGEKFKKLEDSLNNNFKEIIKNIIILSVVLIIFIALLVGIITRATSPRYEKVALKPKENPVNLTEQKDNLISVEDFEFPVIGAFDVTTDYIDLAPVKKIKIPDYKPIIKEYDMILDDSVNGSLKYNFEKRKGM